MTFDLHLYYVSINRNLNQNRLINEWIGNKVLFDLP